MSIPWKPHEYQKRAVKFCVSHACGGLLLDPGLGKSSIILATYSLLKKQGLTERMLIVCPLRPAYSVWPGEASKWTDFAHLKINVLHGPDKERLLGEDADIHVINPEGLPWLFAHKFAGWPWDILTIDESTRFKHTNTLRFKTLKPHLGKFRRRYILTGSPAPNGLLDLFGQIYVLDLGHSLGRFITHYRNTYFDPTGFGGYTWLPKSGATERIQEKLKPLTLRMAAEDYLDLPPLVLNTINVTLPPEARKVYDEMEDLLLAQLEDGVVTAANAAAATMKCRQIANGGLYHTDDDRWTHIHEAKTEAVKELVDELAGKPLLCSYEFHHDRERLNRAFPDAPHIGGGVSPRQQREAEDGWRAGALPLLLAQPQSVAHGINLQSRNAAVAFHSLTFDLEIYEQFIRRVWRQGQQDRVIVHHVVAEDTIDEVIMRCVQKKGQVQQNLLVDLKEHLRLRKTSSDSGATSRKRGRAGSG